MSNNSTYVELTSTDNRKVIIRANGPKDATVLIPTSNSNFNFISKEAIEADINALVSDTTLLAKPSLTRPTNGAANYTSDILLANYPLQALPGKQYYSVLYQISDSPDFSNLVVDKIKSGESISPVGTLPTTVSNFTKDEIINSGVLGSTASRIIRYYLRVKVFHNNYVSPWSDVYNFTYSANAYATPSITSVEMQQDPELKKRNIDKYTGAVLIKTTGYTVSSGTLSKPDYALVKVTGTSGSNNGSKVYRIPYTGSDILFIPDWKPEVANSEPTSFIPGNNYNIELSFEVLDGTGVIVTSPSSNVKSISVPRAKFIIDTLTIVQNYDDILSAPTVGIRDMYSDYDIINMLTNGTPYLDSNPNNVDNRYIKYSFNIFTSTGTPFASKVITAPLYTFKDKDGIASYKGCLVTMDNAKFSISQSYGLQCEITLMSGNTPDTELTVITPLTGKTQGVNYEEFQIKSNQTVVNTDNLDTVTLTYPRGGASKFTGYFGEIVGKTGANGLMPDIKYRGVIKEGATYNSLDEVVYNNELYLVRRDGVTINTGYTPNTNDMVKITPDNIKTYYKSALPTYEWLAREVGLPVGEGFSLDTKGNISAKAPTSSVLNKEDGWIKLHNFANQIIYVAKKPILSNIPYRELRRRFLTGTYTRTIRIGLNYYSVRLMETGPNSVIDEKLIKQSNIANALNYQNEVGDSNEMYSNIFRNLFTYQLEDLGILEEDNKTFTSKGMISTVEGIDQFGAKNISTTFRELNVSDYDTSDKGYYYRPVLELIRETNLPFRKSKNLPGGTAQGAYLEYDKWSDTGYYGEVTSDSLLTAKEIKDLFNIDGLTSLPTSLSFHKFYYHGLVMYIPKSPIGVLPKEDRDTLLTNDIIFGTDKNFSTLFRGTRWSMCLPNFSSSYYINYDKLYTNTATINKATNNSIIADLISRVSPKFDSILGLDVPNHTKWTTGTKYDEALSPDLDNFYIKDMVTDTSTVAGPIPDKESFLSNVDLGRYSNGVKAKTSYGDVNDFLANNVLWPIIFTECLDLSKELNYTNAVVGKPIYNKVTKQVTVYKTVSKQVERERIVNHPVEKIVEVQYQVDKEVETGNSTFNTVPRTSNDKYGLVLFYAKKADACYITTPLYSDKSLNVVNMVNGLGLKFSTTYPSVENYMLKSVICFKNPKTSLFVPEPIIINKFFSDTRLLRSYLSSLISSKHSIGSLRNYAYDIVNNSPDRNKPYGMLYGKISSGNSFFPVPDWYNLYEDKTLGLTMNKDTIISINATGGYENTWSALPDTAGNMHTVPLLSSFLPYEDYSTLGKNEIIEYLLPYIANKEYNNITVDNYQLVLQDIRDNYCFGIVGVECDTLCTLQGNGIVSGDQVNPSFLGQLAPARMDKYFANKSTVTDLFNPVKTTITVSETITKQETIMVDNFVKETYTETVFEEVKETVNKSWYEVTYS